MDSDDDGAFQFLWELPTPHPELLLAADRTHPATVERWSVTAHDRVTLSSHRAPMEDVHARYLWSVTAPLHELVDAGERAALDGVEQWALSDPSRTAMRRFGLPVRFLGRAFGCHDSGGPLAARTRDGCYHLAPPRSEPGTGPELSVRCDTGRVTYCPPRSCPPNRRPIGASLVHVVEIAWRWSQAARVLDALAETEEMCETEEIASHFLDLTCWLDPDFADLVRWIDPDSEFAELFPLVDVL